MSASDTVQALCYLSKDYGRRVHADPRWNRDGRADGKAAWQVLKPILDRAKGVGAWTACRTSDAATDAALLRKLEAYEAREAVGYKTCKVSPEDAHFYAQHLRIPAKEECTVRRICQVFYNAGQLEGSGALARFADISPRWPEMYGVHKLGRPETYCRDFAAFDVPSDLVVDVVQQLADADQLAGAE